MKKYQIVCVCVALTFFSIIGCGKKSNLPEDFPEIFSLKITVTQEGSPLEGAMVSLKPIGTADKYANGCSGISAQDGVASIKTFGYEGVPAGKYKILISKMQDEEGKEIEDEFGGKNVVGAKVYSYIEEKYYSETETPFEAEVVKGGDNTITCDAGKSIRVFVRNAS
jgi:hypothetical protein